MSGNLYLDTLAIALVAPFVVSRATNSVIDGLAERRTGRVVRR